MSQYGIMRVEKRGRSAVYGLQIENEREQSDGEKRTFDNSDIDWTRTQQNEHLMQSKQWNRDITEQIKAAGCREKKNSIVMLDGFYGASPEWFEQHDRKEIDQYFRQCLDFHVKTYCQGDRSRVINAVVHWDEATPHLHVESVPLMQDARGWHLSAKDIMGGRMDYRHRQDEFYEDVSKAHGLERGEVAEYQQEHMPDGERHMKRPEDMKKHLTVMEYKNQQEVEKVQEIQQEKQAAINERDAARREKTQAEAQAAKYRQEAQKAQDAAVKIKDTEGQLETVRQELKQTLDMKARASEIHHVFGDKEVQEYHKNMLESTRAIGMEAYEHMKSAEQEYKAAAKERCAAQQLRDETADLTPEKRRAEQAAEKAEAAQERAEEYERDIADYIIGTAQNIAEKAVEKAVAPEKDDYTQRLEQFMADYQIGGKSLLDRFREQEQERAARLKREAERHVFEQEEQAKRAARDWDYER